MFARVAMGTSSIDARRLLTHGALTVKGQLPWSSNVTLLVELTLDGATTLAVYKPERGERPLWDFPSGLFRREIAAYHLSEALGWGLVPLTVERSGPYGDGSLQCFVDADFTQHYFTLREEPTHQGRLQQVCLFDLVANNADRKSGHCLLGANGVIYSIDNALCFHPEPKLRTVIWEFGGAPIPRKLLRDVQRLLATELPAPLTELLAPGEPEALLLRARRIVDRGRFPEDRSGVRYPWPPV